MTVKKGCTEEQKEERIVETTAIHGHQLGHETISIDWKGHLHIVVSQTFPAHRGYIYEPFWYTVCAWPAIYGRSLTLCP